MKISETIITTLNAAGVVHITPFGIKERDGMIEIAPFKPSTTLENILQSRVAVVNFTDDVRVFASALTKKQVFPVETCEVVDGVRLTETLSHIELELVEVIDDDLRPTLKMRPVYVGNHKPFMGFNRAQAAVIELAVLVSRLHMLPKEKILKEKQYLQIAIDKTAGAIESEAWQWLEERIDAFYAAQEGGDYA